MNLDHSLKGHFLNLYHMALSDSEVDTQELELLYKIGHERGVTEEEINAVIIRPDSVKFSAPEGVSEKIESLYDLTRIAWADGRIDPNEKRVLEMFCAKFGFAEENISAIIQFLLDAVEKNTSKEEILKIVNQYI